MTKERPDWEGTEQRRQNLGWDPPSAANNWGSDARASRDAWSRDILFTSAGEKLEVTCATCHHYSTANIGMMAVHALGCVHEELNSLAVLLEAELIIMEHHADRRGCGCSRHRPWKVTT